MSKDIGVLDSMTVDITLSDVSCGVMCISNLTEEDQYNSSSDNYDFEAKFNVQTLRDLLTTSPVWGQRIFKGYTYVFSDVDKYGGGLNLAKIIRKFKLGKLVSTGKTTNPNSGNIIRTWLWVYNGNTIPKRAANV